MTPSRSCLRCDGAWLTEVDLAECVPIHPTELDELVWPIDLVEDWLLHASPDTLHELARFLGNNSFGPTPAHVTEQLGRASVKLHRLIRGTGSQA